MASACRCCENALTPGEDPQDADLNMVVALMECLQHFEDAQPGALVDAIASLERDCAASSQVSQTIQGARSEIETVFARPANDAEATERAVLGREDAKVQPLRDSNRPQLTKDKLSESSESKLETSQTKLSDLSYQSLKRRYDKIVNMKSAQKIQPDVHQFREYDDPSNELQNTRQEGVHVNFLSDSNEIIDLEDGQDDRQHVHRYDSHAFPIPFKVEAFTPIPPDIMQYAQANFLGDFQNPVNETFSFTQMSRNGNQDNSTQDPNFDIFADSASRNDQTELLSGKLVFPTPSPRGLDSQNAYRTPQNQQSYNFDTQSNFQFQDDHFAGNSERMVGDIMNPFAGMEFTGFGDDDTQVKTLPPNTNRMNMDENSMSSAFPSQISGRLSLVPSREPRDMYDCLDFSTFPHFGRGNFVAKFVCTSAYIVYSLSNM